GHVREGGVGGRFEQHVLSARQHDPAVLVLDEIAGVDGEPGAGTAVSAAAVGARAAAVVVAARAEREQQRHQPPEDAHASIVAEAPWWAQSAPSAYLGRDTWMERWSPERRVTNTFFSRPSSQRTSIMW